MERFVQEILDHPDNREWFESHKDRDALAKELWHEGLVTIYRLLFIFKLESSDDPARSFTFASTSLWRNTFSPSMALARFAHPVLEEGQETGNLLEAGLRNLYRMFEKGLECTELVVKPLGGALFGADATPVLSERAWGERAVARLLWTPKKRGQQTPLRVARRGGPGSCLRGSLRAGTGHFVRTDVSAQAAEARSRRAPGAG